MPDYHPDLTNDDLADWHRVLETDLRWDGILLGNGASISVWDDFSYPSLFDRARSERVGAPLTADDQNLFAAFDTQNFELVLGALKTAGRVATALDIETIAMRERYTSIQRALFEAVGDVHIPWEQVAGDVLPKIRRALGAYRAVFSTNYDLLVYWAVMHEREGRGFKDFFWGGADRHSFDPTDVEIWDNSTRLYYLHGGLHLRRLADGGTRKRVADDVSLLDDFETAFESDEIPLLVSEGTAQDKLDAIRRSDYLSFAYGALGSHRGGLVVFGHSLGEMDEHIVSVINSWRAPHRDPLIAISIRGSAEPDHVRQQKLYYAHRLPHADLLFFDPDTHPLGEPFMRG